MIVHEVKYRIYGTASDGELGFETRGKVFRNRPEAARFISQLNNEYDKKNLLILCEVKNEHGTTYNIPKFVIPKSKDSLIWFMNDLIKSYVKDNPRQ